MPQILAPSLAALRSPIRNHSARDIQAVRQPARQLASEWQLLHTLLLLCMHPLACKTNTGTRNQSCSTAPRSLQSTLQPRHHISLQSSTAKEQDSWSSYPPESGAIGKTCTPPPSSSSPATMPPISLHRHAQAASPMSLHASACYPHADAAPEQATT